VGITSLELNTYDKKFDFANNPKQYLINNASMDFGINADFIFKKMGNPAGTVSPISGLRAGYRLSVENKVWRDFDGNKLNNMPSYSQNGFYVTLSIG
jgi:hypothetical protein